MRLFVALYPPAEVAEALLAVTAGLDLPPHRLVPAGQVHVTVQFIGERDPRELDDIAESVRRSAAGLGPFTLTPQRLITLPTRGPRRLVAAETDAPAPLPELKQRLVTRLAKPGKRGSRGFLPHLTLLRFRRPAPGASVPPAVPDATAFRVDRVALMRSTLHPSGARHEELESVPLDGG